LLRFTVDQDEGGAQCFMPGQDVVQRLLQRLSIQVPGQVQAKWNVVGLADTFHLG
jgi:hypothetical protein